MYSFNACRVCLKASESLTPIDSKNSKELSFQFMLTYCIGDINWGADKYSSLICNECAKEVEKVYDFKKAAIQADICRKEYIKLLEMDTIEIVVEGEEQHQSPDSATQEYDTQSDEKGFDDLIPAHKIMLKMKPTKRRPPNKENKKQKPELPDYADEENCYCKLCDRTFTKRSSLVSHVRNIHTLEKIHSCDLCEESFTNRDLLKRHIVKHTGERNYVCFLCGKRYRTSSDLNHHLQYHENQNKYRCDICDKSFKAASILWNHKIVVHTKVEDRKHVCPQCGKRFALRVNLSNHMKRHLNIRDFKCEICGKGFIANADLTKHLRAHQNMQMHVCQVCGKVFKFKFMLNGHLNVEHGLPQSRKRKVDGEQET